MAAAVLAKQILRDVDGVLLLGVGRDVLEDVHRLQRFGKGAALLAQHLVLAVANARRVLVPEIREQVAHRAGDVVAVLLVLVEALDADAVRIEQHELPHPADHLAHPAANVDLRPNRERAIEDEHQVRVLREPDVRRITSEIRDARGECVSRLRVVEAARQLVEQRRLRTGGQGGLVLERIRDAAEQIGREHRAAERSGQHADAQREGARHGRKHVAPETLGSCETHGIVHRARLHWLAGLRR